MGRLLGKTCIITGASRGIGRARATCMAQEGARLALFDVLDEEGHSLADQLSSAGLTARYWHVDVARESDVCRAIHDVAATFGSVDVLINNAGIAGADKPTYAFFEAEWDSRDGCPGGTGSNGWAVPWRISSRSSTPCPGRARRMCPGDGHSVDPGQQNAAWARWSCA